MHGFTEGEEELRQEIGINARKRKRCCRGKILQICQARYLFLRHLNKNAFLDLTLSSEILDNIFDISVLRTERRRAALLAERTRTPDGRQRPTPTGSS